MKNNKINELAHLFIQYQIYSKDCYDSYSPVSVFQKEFPQNYYAKDLEIFISQQNYESIQRGADLPWWGKKYFTKEINYRVMVISQDSLAKDAGSIVFAAHFFPPELDFDRYQKYYPQYINEMGVKKYFSPNKLRKVIDQFIEWGIDFDFLYITDASKVYKEGSWKDKDFDKTKSKKLLELEIEFCKPDLIILLGAQPLNLLDKTKNYNSIIESGKSILVNDKKCVVAPFFIGNGPAGNKNGRGFKKRLEIASNLIKIFFNQGFSL